MVLLLGGLFAAAGAVGVVQLWALAAVLIPLGMRDGWMAPALELGENGIRYVQGLRRRTARWEEIEAVRVRQERHWLAFGRNLELDLADESLIVLSRWQLGADPDQVAAAVETWWHGAVRSTTPFEPGSR